MPATAPLPDDDAEIRRLAAEVGYPLMLKASWGGGGRGMRPIESEDGLIDAVKSAKREAKSAFGKDEVYLEKLVRRARHVEVQLLGDKHGQRLHLFERDCSIQRRHQKVVERAPAPYIDAATREALCQSALKIGDATNYVGAGTVEFLLDADTGKFYFIEVNPRIQVEHTVTEAGDGARYRQGADQNPRRRSSRAISMRPAFRRRTISGLKGTLCNAGSRPKIRTIISSPITAASPLIVALSVLASASMGHRLFRRGRHPLLRCAA